MNDYKLKILRNERAGDGIYEMLLTRPEGVDPKGAQFIHIKLKNGSRILRRPFCICDCTESGILICYAAVGEGTKELASYAAGEEVEAVLPLGNGWSADDWKTPSCWAEVWEVRCFRLSQGWQKGEARGISGICE